MDWKQFSDDYLAFSRRDRVGILTLLVIILAVLVLPALVTPGASKSPVAADTTWMASVSRIQENATESQPVAYNSPSYNNNSSHYQFDRSVNSYPSGTKGELFPFDPNTLSPAGWKKLGLRDKTIGTIQNYLAKGGHFYKPEDLSRVYGLFKDEYDRLAPYIRIENTERVFTQQSKETFTPRPKTERYVAIDINTADTSAYIALPGIGSKLAARIVNFRDKLGGFHSISQVAETFGLPDSTFQKVKQYLRLDNPQVKKINVNTATIDELKAHPYIRYSLANPIIAYRKEHGAFAKLEDLKKVMAVTEEVYGKIVPYLIVE